MIDYDSLEYRNEIELMEAPKRTQPGHLLRHDRRAVTRGTMGNLKTRWKHGGGLFLLAIMSLMIIGWFVSIGLLR